MPSNDFAYVRAHRASSIDPKAQDLVQHRQKYQKALLQLGVNVASWSEYRPSIVI